MLKGFVLLLLMFPVQAIAQGGPPMVTDDPGTPGDKHWEINIVGLLAKSSNQNILQFPYFDINYGLGDRVQLKVETGWVTTFVNAPATQSGEGTVLVGVKYRFLDEDKAGVAVSMYPQIGNPSILPFEFSKSFGNWEVNPEVGYFYGTVISSGILYGTVVAFEKAKPWEPLGEIHVNTRLDGSGSTTLLNLGLRYTFNPSMNLLLALGQTLTHTADTTNELDAYVGIQLEL